MYFTFTLSLTLVQLMDNTKFSKEQIIAKNNIINSFERVHWVILTDQMQSGKTFTILLTACELLMSGKIDNVIIFSGNSELDLKEQISKQILPTSNFWKLLHLWTFKTPTLTLKKYKNINFFYMVYNYTILFFLFYQSYLYINI